MAAADLAGDDGIRDLDDLGNRGAGPAGLTHGVGQGEEVVGAGCGSGYSVVRRTTSQPRGAVRRVACSAQRSYVCGSA